MTATSLALAPSPLLLKDRTAARVHDASNLGKDALADAGIIPSQARISILRQSPDDVGFREIFVSIDGDQLGILSHGDSLTTEVPSGPHRLRAHNTLFWKTLTLVLKPGEHARFNAVNRAGWGTFGMLFFLGAMPVYLTFERMALDAPSASDIPSPLDKGSS